MGRPSGPRRAARSTGAPALDSGLMLIATDPGRYLCVPSRLKLCGCCAARNSPTSTLRSCLLTAADPISVVNCARLVPRGRLAGVDLTTGHGDRHGGQGRVGRALLDGTGLDIELRAVARAGSTGGDLAPHVGADRGVADHASAGSGQDDRAGWRLGADRSGRLDVGGGGRVRGSSGGVGRGRRGRSGGGCVRRGGGRGGGGSGGRGGAGTTSGGCGEYRGARGGQDGASG